MRSFTIMNDVVQIQAARRQLPPREKWQVARWLLEDLEENGHGQAGECSHVPPVPLPDYAARRRRIFGDKVLPNLVLAGRGQSRLFVNRQHCGAKVESRKQKC